MFWRDDNSIPRNQSWLIQRMQALGYKSDLKGICHGVAYMGMQAILAKDVESFDKRLSEIAAIPLAKINETTTKNDIAAFFDGVEIYHQAQLYPDLFAPQQAPTTQDASLAMPLVLSKKLEDQGGVYGRSCSYGIYDKEDLKKYFTILSACMENTSEPVALVLGGSGHTITLGLDHEKKEWLFINANQLPTQHIKLNNIEALLNQVITSLARNNVALFSTKIYGLKSSQDQLDTIIDKLNANERWREIHAVTKEKSLAKAVTLDSSNISLLELAISHNDLEKIKQLVDFGADLNITRDGFDILAVIYEKPDIRNYLAEAMLKKLLKKLDELKEPDETSNRYLAILSFKNNLQEAVNKQESKVEKYLTAKKLCHAFLSIDEMLTSIAHFNDDNINEFIDQKYEYLMTLSFLKDIESPFKSIINTTKNELKKLAMDFQEKYVSKSQFSLLASFHPQSGVTKEITNVVEKKYIFNL